MNGAIYQELWNDVQIGFFDPGQTGNLTFGTNGQDFKIRGIESSIEARVTQGLTLTTRGLVQQESTDQFAVTD